MEESWKKGKGCSYGKNGLLECRSGSENARDWYKGWDSL